MGGPRRPSRSCVRCGTPSWPEKIPYDAGPATLELAVAYTEQGRTFEIKRLGAGVSADL